MPISLEGQSNQLITVALLRVVCFEVARFLQRGHFCIPEAVDKVADRLLGPFNIEMLVRPINLKISEAIMNFQENSHDVSQRVFTGCGRPVLGRRRRDNRELELESLNFDQETSTDDHAPTAAILDKLVKEIRQRVRDSRQFWVYLPYKLCNDGLVVPPSNTKECWNGTHVDK